MVENGFHSFIELHRKNTSNLILLREQNDYEYPSASANFRPGGLQPP